MPPADGAPAKPQPPVRDPGLPPVQPPTAGFLLQLFLIPMIIVTIIVLVWLAFTWLAHQGVDPHDLARSLRTRNDASWQKAYNLSNMMRDPDNQALKRDQELADELIAVLDRELDVRPTESSAGVGERTYQTAERVRLREFLATALGEFELIEVADVLARAARQEQTPEDLTVRRKAVAALAVLADTVGPRLDEKPEALEAVLEASRDRSANPEERLARGELRATAAFALGVIGGDEALARLDAMLGDAYPNARFNAATGLARHGDPRSVPTLAAMLDPTNEEAVDDELSDEARRFKRSTVMSNGIRAVRMLAEANRDADLRPLTDALESLADANVSRDVRLAAKETMAMLSERAVGGS